MTFAANVVDEETPLLPAIEAPPPRQRPNPLPVFQLGIILFMQLCEPITSQSIYPYINQLISELDITGGDERKVGYYAGLIESLFFATEALTVLQWSRLSDHAGRKPVLLIGLVGTVISMLGFGLSRTFWGLVLSRCLCGLLNGNIGVMKSVMGELTDSTNRAEGFALMPVVWAAGSTIGPLMGGSLSKPYERFPLIFTSTFWKDYPYFLPCVATSSFVFGSIIVTALFFKETVPKRKRTISVTSNTELNDSKEEKPLPLREIFVYPVIISVLNYVTLAFLNISLNALLPLFFAMPVELGGLGFKPATIGYACGSYGALTGIVNIFFFSRIIRHFGEKFTFVYGMMVFPPIFILMPIINICARQWGIGPLVWTLVALVLFLMVFMDMAYGSIFIFVTASAPNKRSLGATNGLSQMTVSIARAIGPALSTSLFSYSLQYNILGGYGVYGLMIILSLMSLIIANQLPAQVWKEKDEN